MPSVDHWYPPHSLADASVSHLEAAKCLTWVPPTSCLAECYWFSVVSGCHIVASCYTSGCPLRHDILRLNSYLLISPQRWCWGNHEWCIHKWLQIPLPFPKCEQAFGASGDWFQNPVERRTGKSSSMKPLSEASQDLKSCILTTIQRFNLLCAC